MEQWIRSLPRGIRFCLSGGVATGVNVALMILFVEWLKMDSFILKGLANFLAMAIGAIAAFFLHRAWTWDDSTKYRGVALLQQIARFVSSLVVGVGSRIGMFAVMDYYFHIAYLLNVAVGILCAAIVDYYLYDRLVFARRKA